MSMYAISENTLTALGDAVRSKVIGTNELSINSIFNLKYQYNSDVMFEEFNLGGVKTKIKINSITNDLGYSYGEGAYPWSDIGIVLKGGYTKPPNNSDVAITISKGITFPYEVIADSGVITFLFMGTTSNRPMTLDVELTALDENGNEYKYTPLEMADKINGLMTIPNEALTIAGSCLYRFSYNGWNWFLDICKNKITTTGITDCGNMFYYSNTLTEIPFDINILATTSNLNSVFNSCNKLKSVPYIIGPERAVPTSSYSGTVDLANLFSNCYNLREIPDDYFWKMIPNKDYWDKCSEITSRSYNSLFNCCCSLRKLPDISMLKGAWTSPYSAPYYSLCSQCYALDEINDLIVAGTYTSNVFSSTVNSATRLKCFTFETNDDSTPKTANWKSQTLDFSSFVGYESNYSTAILNYNSGITADKEVKDDATYQALKNDPDWFSRDMNYSRYNHNSAVNTINSLPDTSAYGTNIIKFKGQSGALTDGGAINTLTEEEIAVATAKGWTVSLV